MKLLRIKASHFKNCQDDTVDLVAKSKKTTEDKEYELQEVLKACMCTTLERLSEKMLPVKQLHQNCWIIAIGIFEQVSLENKHYSYEGIKLEIIFFYMKGMYVNMQQN